MIAKQVISYLHRDERMLHMDELERELQLELERVQKKPESQPSNKPPHIQSRNFQN